MPVGTVIRDTDTGEVIADLNHHGVKALLAQGGKGGLGNLHFKSSVNRAPKQFTPGEPGQYRSLELELKVLADVGLLGHPNAGKSTFITAVSNARPKIADYPFTTLHPHLGVVRVGPNRALSLPTCRVSSRVRPKVPVSVIFSCATSRARRCCCMSLTRRRSTKRPIRSRRRKALAEELEKYDPALAAKPRWIVLNKMDLVPEEEREALISHWREAFAKEGEPVFAISAAARQGVEALVKALAQKIDEDRRAEMAFLDDERFEGEDAPAYEPYDPTAH